MSESVIKRPVGASADLSRVCALPRRWWSNEAREIVADDLSRYLLNVEGLAVLRSYDTLASDARAAALSSFARECCPIMLSSDQAIILHELREQRGALALAPVGAGKTLLLWLACVIAEEFLGSTTHLLMVPAYLRDDTLAAHQQYARYWRAPRRPVNILTYAEIGIERYAYALCDCAKCLNGAEKIAGVTYESAIKPTFIALDEADVMASDKSAAAARVDRYQRNHREGVHTLAATGTLVQDSLREMFRLFSWALKERAPIPYEYVEQELWCAAMDPSPGRSGRSSPAALIKAFAGDLLAADPRAEARRVYGRRLADTPGFVVVDKASCDTPINISVIAAPRDEAIEDLMLSFRDTGCAADGYVLGDALSCAAYEEALGCGYYDRWDPRPPSDWLEARNAYHAAVADVIAKSARRGAPIDTERQARRVLAHSSELAAWLAIRDTFTPNPVPVMVSMSVVSQVAQWLHENHPAIAWVDSTWLGEALEAATGVSYFARNGESRARKKPQQGESIIASLKSNYRGRNWWRWSRNLVVCALASNKWQEQVIGRTHRQGQRDPVSVTYLASSRASLRAFARAQERAQGTTDLFGLRQKIITATWDWSAVPDAVSDAFVARNESAGFRARWHPER